MDHLLEGRFVSDEPEPRLGHGLDEPVDEILEAMFERMHDADAPVLSPTGWLAAVSVAVGETAGQPYTTRSPRCRGGLGVPDRPRWMASLERVILVALQASEAHSVVPDPGSSTDPKLILGLLYWNVAELVAERGWTDGDSSLWFARLAALVGEYAGAVEAWAAAGARSKDGPAIELAGPRALAVAATSALCLSRRAGATIELRGTHLGRGLDRSRVRRAV